MSALHTQAPLDPAPAPTVCPFCGSSKITTTSAKVETSSYWRCGTCGDVWNVERLRTSNRRNQHYEGRWK
jgi:transposase-like protein